MARPWHSPLPSSRTPDFDQLLKVLRRERPDRPVLYEIFMNNVLYADYAGSAGPLDWSSPRTFAPGIIQAYRNLGYDYANIWGLYTYSFLSGGRHKEETVSLNEGGVIASRQQFEQYPWTMPERAQFLPDDFLCGILPRGMKLVPLGPGGVLENVITLTGYSNLCMMLLEDPELARDIFDAVGERLVRLYEIMVRYESVGAVVSNDDWGFKTQTMISPEHMREYVVPWHQRIVRTAHEAGKPVILHSCGYPVDVMEDIIGTCAFDAKHSWEDTIVPVEQGYDRWGGRIAVMGGIDVDFLCRATPDEIHARARALLERSNARGAYALGSGNSIPEYIPRENYLAMVSAAW